MDDEIDFVRAHVIDEIARLMINAGNSRQARIAAAFANCPGIPDSLVAAAELRADAILEERFLAPLRLRFADRLAKERGDCDSA